RGPPRPGRPLRVGAGLPELVGRAGRRGFRDRGGPQGPLGVRGRAPGGALAAVTDLLVRSAAEPAGDGLLVEVSPTSAGWRYVGFEVLRLAGGRRAERRTEGREVCAVLLSGRA